MANRINNQIQPKEGQIHTYETLCGFDMKTLEGLCKDMELRLKQRGSSRPVSSSTADTDNKLNEREYLKLIKRAIKENTKSERKILNFKLFKESQSYNL